MMKLLAGCVAVAAVALAACAGSAGSGGSPPTSPPGTTYSSRITFIGALSGNKAQSVGIRPLDAATPSPIPIMVVAPITADGHIGSQVYDIFGGTVEALASPVPSPLPSVTFSTTNNGSVLLATPTPAPSASPVALASGVIGTIIAHADGTPNVQSCGTASATISAPVSSSATTTSCTYRAIALQCISPLVGGGSPGWHWSGSAWVAVNTAAAADIYLTGPTCNIAGFVSGEPHQTIHFPGGGTTISTNSAFNSIAASQWTNAQATADMHTIITFNPDGSINAIILAKTADGAHIFKLWPNALNQSSGEYDGAINVAGASADGF